MSFRSGFWRSHYLGIWIIFQKPNFRIFINQKIKFFVNAHERSGLLADLLHTIANAGFEIKEAKAKLIDMEHAQCNFLVIPRNLEHLKELVKRVSKVKGVMKVFFEWSVNLSYVFYHIYHSVTITPFIIIPSNNLY